LGAEPQGEVPLRAQWNGPASGPEGDSLPLLPALMPQPLENEVTPLLHAPIQTWPFLVSILRAAAEEPSAKVPPPSWGAVNLQATWAPLGRLRVVRFYQVVMVEPNTCSKGVCGAAVHCTYSMVPNPRWEQALAWERPSGGLVLGRGCFLIREL